MPVAPKALTARFRPSFREAGSAFWVTRFELFNDVDRIDVEFNVTSVDELRSAIAAKANELGVPAVNADGREVAEVAWNVFVRPVGGRWPRGFKAAFESSDIVRPKAVAA